MIRIALTAGLLLAAATPAVAADKVPAHCTKQMVHTPAGKTVHNVPVLFCAAIDKDAVAKADPTPRTPTQPAVAKD